MPTMIRDENSESGFREATKTEETMLAVLDGVQGYILAGRDPRVLVQSNDCDAIEGLVELVKGNVSSIGEKEYRWVCVKCSREPEGGHNGFCPIDGGQYERALVRPKAIPPGVSFSNPTERLMAKRGVSDYHSIVRAFPYTDFLNHLYAISYGYEEGTAERKLLDSIIAKTKAYGGHRRP